MTDEKVIAPRATGMFQAASDWINSRRVSIGFLADSRDRSATWAGPASLLIEQGANVKYIQQQLGHGSISITLDIYSHPFQDDHRHQVHRLDDPQADLNSSTSATPESATQAQPHCRQQLDGHSGAIELKKEPAYGGVTERPNVPVLKTGDLVRGPRVQISPPPPYFLM